MRDFIKRAIYRFEGSFFSNVVKRGLGMMIPLLLAGGMARALQNLPIAGYKLWLTGGAGQGLDAFFEIMYQGTFGIFSVAMVIALSLSYAMEKNESYDYAGMYVIVSLASFGVQLDIGGPYFSTDNLGTNGCFTALFVTYLACMAFSALRRVRFLTLEELTAGMSGVSVHAINSFLPLTTIVCVFAVFNKMLQALFGVNSIQELVTAGMCSFFEAMMAGNGFWSGLLYTVLVHVFWFFGLHGSMIMEPVANNTFALTGDTILSGRFFHLFVVMGGCGTTICVLIALFLFFRKSRLGKLAGLSCFTVIFNMNEMLTFGLPIILNPILMIPFIVTPVVSYCIAYAATATGLVPLVTQDVSWTMPVLLSGYIATGSVRGTLLQLVCIAVGVFIYLPFLRLNERVEGVRSKEHVQVLIRELQAQEEVLERPPFLTRGDHIGVTSRMLLQDLKHAIENRELFMLYQPQVSADGRCVGAEALLRWNHPAYGMIYPPLIIYLAEEGKILPELEDYIIEEVAKGIAKIQKAYDGPFKVSVNLTAHSLLWDVDQCIDRYLNEYQISAERLWIEITEQDILLQTEAVTSKLNILKKAGHMLLIDDFGMGHTSLLYLQSNFFDIVKLDGSLTRKLVENPTNQKIIASIAELGHELKVGLIAEYVEDEEQRSLLEKLGCTCYQGYLYSKPIPLEEFIEYIIGRNTEWSRSA